MIGHEHDREQREDGEADRIDVGAAARDQMRRRAHGGEVGTDVDRVGDKQERHQDPDDGPGEDARHVGGKPVPGDTADAGADRLHGDDQRQDQHHGPHQPDAELGTCLRMGGDAARIVVGRAGDDPRPQPLEQLPQQQPVG